MIVTYLQGLGQEKFRKIVDLLKQRISRTLVVQLIQDQWGDCCEVPADTLAKELESLRTDLITNSEISEASTAGDAFKSQLLPSSGHYCLDKMVELAVIRERRIEVWQEREERSGCMFPQIDVMINGYAKQLEDIQRTKCFLGIEPYASRMPESIKKRREDRERERQGQQRVIWDAYATAQEVFKKAFETRYESRRESGGTGTETSGMAQSTNG